MDYAGNSMSAEGFKLNPLSFTKDIDMAFILGCGWWPVMEINLDVPQKYDDLATYGRCTVSYGYNRFSSFGTSARLVCDRGRFYLRKEEDLSGDTSNSYEMSMEEFIHETWRSQEPVIEPGDTVMFSCYSRRKGIKAIVPMTMAGIREIQYNNWTIGELRPVDVGTFKMLREDIDNGLRNYAAILKH